MATPAQNPVSDQTSVLCSNLGVHMRYWDSAAADVVTAPDPRLHTECVQKLALMSTKMYRTPGRKLGGPSS